MAGGELHGGGWLELVRSQAREHRFSPRLVEERQKRSVSSPKVSPGCRTASSRRSMAEGGGGSSVTAERCSAGGSLIETGPVGAVCHHSCCPSISNERVYFCSSGNEVASAASMGVAGATGAMRREVTTQWGEKLREDVDLAFYRLVGPSLPWRIRRGWPWRRRRARLGLGRAAGAGVRAWAAGGLANR